jgi:hypothetical protein
LVNLPCFNEYFTVRNSFSSDLFKKKHTQNTKKHKKHMAHQFQGFGETVVDTAAVAPYVYDTGVRVVNAYEYDGFYINETPPVDDEDVDNYEYPVGHKFKRDVIPPAVRTEGGVTLQQPTARIAGAARTTAVGAVTAHRSRATKREDHGEGTPTTTTWVKLSIFGAYVLALVALGVAISQDCPCDRASNTHESSSQSTVGAQPSAAYSDGALANLTEKVSQHTSRLAEHTSRLTEHDSRINEHHSILAEHDSRFDEHDSILAEHDSRINEHHSNLTEYDSRINEHHSILAEHDSLLQFQSEILQNITQTVQEPRVESAESESVFTGDVIIDFTNNITVSFWISIFADFEVVAGTVTFRGSTVRASYINAVLRKIKHIHGSIDVSAVSFAEGDDMYLPKLETVGNNLIIAKNPQLTSANFSALQSIGGDLRITSNYAIDDKVHLTSVHFSQLQSIGGVLQVVHNNQLALADFSVLHSIGGSIDIGDNHQLALAVFPVLQSSGGSISIGSNDQLKSIDFSGLQYISSSFHILSNDRLTSADFSALQSINGNLGIANNGKLHSLDFSVLRSIGGNLQITANKINLCTAQTVSNALGHTTLRSVCAGVESPECSASYPAYRCL